MMFILRDMMPSTSPSKLFLVNDLFSHWWFGIHFSFQQIIIQHEIADEN